MTVEYPSVFWKKFFEKFSELETTETKLWSKNLIIAYICKKYKEHYGVEYTFKFNTNSPSKSFEVAQINKLSMQLSSDPVIIKDYIDWLFTTQMVAKKRRITSLAFMVDTKLINQYKFKYLITKNNSTIDRASIIPTNYSTIIKKYDNSISTYGELSFIKKCKDSNNIDQKYIDMLNELNKEGLDLTMLDKVK